MQTESNTIEGTWEEISQLASKFNGHRLRVTILTNEAGSNQTRPPLSDKAKSAIAYLQARIANEATDDPDEIQEAQDELDEMKRSMNEERRRSGAEPIF